MWQGNYGNRCEEKLKKHVRFLVINFQKPTPQITTATRPKLYKKQYHKKEETRVTTRGKI